jgi:hypothetical protein
MMNVWRVIFSAVSMNIFDQSYIVSPSFTDFHTKESVFSFSKTFQDSTYTVIGLELDIKLKMLYIATRLGTPDAVSSMNTGK